MENSIIPTTTNQKALALYDEMGDVVPVSGVADRQMVTQLAQVIKQLSPQGDAVPDSVYMAMANASLILGVNPTPGAGGMYIFESTKAERDSSGKETGRKITTYQPIIGVQFWEGEAQMAGGVVWQIRPRPMTKEEREQWSVGTNAVAAFICSGCTGEAFNRFRLETGMAYPEAKMEMGDICHWGIGVFKQGEYEKVGRPAGWVAELRCKKDFFRKACPIGNSGARVRRNAVGQVIGGADWDVSDFIKPAPSGTSKGMTLKQINASLFGSSGDPDSEPSATAGEPQEGEWTQEETPTPPPVTEPEQATAVNGQATDNKPDQKAPAAPQAQATQQKTSGKSAEFMEWWNSLRKIDQDIYIEPGQFFIIAANHIPRYKGNVNHARKALEAFGEPLPLIKDEAKGKRRVELYRMLEAYAGLRDGGMDSEAAVDFIRNPAPSEDAPATEPKQGSLLDDGDDLFPTDTTYTEG